MSIHLQVTSNSGSTAKFTIRKCIKANVFYEFLPEMTQNHEKIIRNGGWEGFFHI